MRRRTRGGSGNSNGSTAAEQATGVSAPLRRRPRREAGFFQEVENRIGSLALPDAVRTTYPR
jgi:hypothetical protein